MVNPKTYLITGGAGFIGSALIRELITHTQHRVINVDKLTYAGNLGSLTKVSANSRYHFVRADICDSHAIQGIFDKYQPDVVMHLAAESHVDRSIQSPRAFMETNVMGTFILLEAARIYWQSLQRSDGQKAKDFRFHHVSTDEIYGSLSEDDSLFLESTAYAPSSPYSASKASSNHLVRAWQRTYELPTLITNCSNNYGPYQFPEKLIPLVILNALAGKPLPVYGNGEQVRDWLFVDDHARALITVANEGKVGDTYNIGGHNEKRNIDVVKALCALLDELVVHKPSGISRFDRLITFVADRPGHDTRYAIDASKIAADLNWAPSETFETGLRKTVLWYLNNQSWWRQVQAGQHHTP